ncbi:FAD-dependent oxidoreductase [Trichocoleus sp. DQ-U1]|uniref:FAD-dependent oxidoreductase n=2 Tax=Cyanophyceae TaxID=3028117 RepID=UPI003298A980
MMNELIEVDVLVVGGGTGGTAAAIQAARRGAKTMLVSEFTWLGGMLTSAGVAAPDGNELAAFQTGLWGEFLGELRSRQMGGLNNSWVSLFSYDPRIGAQIFADWVQELPNLDWVAGQVPLEVLRTGDRILGVRFADFTVQSKITLDGTELGDLLPLASVPYRWGWELQSEFGEPSAPVSHNELTQRYPVQAPTWVAILQDFGEEASAPEIPPPPSSFILPPSSFQGSWDRYGWEQFLNYGRLPGNLFMINWPLCGNDYGEGVGRLIESEAAWHQFLQESLWHTQSFVRFIQTKLGRRYGLATQIFPSRLTPKLNQNSIKTQNALGGGGYALHPYYRESRRLVGLATVREQDILPVAGGKVAPLPVDTAGEVNAIAFGNYPNDHHYPNYNFLVKPKSIRWGGRWTGTPFTLPYTCLIPESVDGLLVCEKNISVSHIANGSTRLQPIVMNIGQAAGMAAALCVQRSCQPRDLPVRVLQEALLQDERSPAAIFPLFNLPRDRADWLHRQRDYLDRPDTYPFNGNCPYLEPQTPQDSKYVEVPSPFTKHSDGEAVGGSIEKSASNSALFCGVFHRHAEQDYTFTVKEPAAGEEQTWIAIALRPEVDGELQTCLDRQMLSVCGYLNQSGKWLIVEKIIAPGSDRTHF